ncbi:MAG: cobalt-precorrin-5B (C(1))-methyltransferase [Methanoregula sp.]|nr:cobalt-precorrin-5B (C(1))-methyltransferase [Methanoregula sp.]
MRDPITGFDYPETWVKKCKSPGLLFLAEEGFAVLTASGTVLRRGYTTGTTAAAACKAAVLSLSGVVTSVPIHLPCGLKVEVPVSALSGSASCKKFAGDYPDDVTAGCEFIAKASPLPEGITLVPGPGIGRFSRDTPRFRKGEPAITPAPLNCILTSIQEAIDQTGLSGARVDLHIPRGTKLAKKTLNLRVGVEGGISVLGTTGLVEPWDDHLEESIRERVSAACNAVLTTGRIGLRYARLLYPDREVVLVGGKIGEALDAAKGDVILFGLPGLILRYINPQILDGTGHITVEEFAGSPAFRPAMLSSLAVFKKGYPNVRVIIVNRNGAIIGESP